MIRVIWLNIWRTEILISQNTKDLEIFKSFPPLQPIVSGLSSCKSSKFEKANIRNKKALSKNFSLSNIFQTTVFLLP